MRAIEKIQKDHLNPELRVMRDPMFGRFVFDLVTFEVKDGDFVALARQAACQMVVCRRNPAVSHGTDNLLCGYKNADRSVAEL